MHPSPDRIGPARASEALRAGSGSGVGTMRLAGSPLTLAQYPARAITNPGFRGFDLAAFERLSLPTGLTGLMDAPPLGTVTLLEDDNRGAVSAEPVATLDGLGFHLSVKGVGSAIDPYSTRPLDAPSAALLTDDADVRRRLAAPTVPVPEDEAPRVLTGELWLRGSPYGGQGLEHATIALKVSERADLTSLEGFLIAPVVKVVLFPPELEERLRTLHWYRRFAGPMAQEVRLVPSNVRIYFHAKQTVGQDVRNVFDTFGVDSNAKALDFELHFVRSAAAMLTLFARTLRREASTDRYFGLDYHDVWLDKDAVLAPNGSVYFVDLEGIEEEPVEAGRVRERIEDQVYRSLYEFMFAYEQIEQERCRRFGEAGSRKAHLLALFTEGLREDRYVRARTRPGSAELEIRNRLGDERLNTTFPLVDL